MKAVGYALIAAAMLAEPAFAGDIQSDLFWISPAFKLQRDGWPKDADGRLIYGEVKLDCAIGANRVATDCTVKSQTPADPKLAEAALKLAPMFKARADSSGRSVLDIDMTFDAQPDWLAKPTINNLMAVWPAGALRKGQNGQATLHCKVTTSGLVRSCTVIKEEPKGWGFGGAALALSSTFLMKPAMKGGAPVEGAEVSVPISFKTDGASEDSTPSSGGSTGRIPDADHHSGPVTVLREAVWDKTPSIPEIKAEIDKKVGDKFADGQVVFQCALEKKTGRLRSCVVANASPGMAQFQGVARSLTSKFRANPDVLGDIKNDVIINLAFSFPDMSSDVWGKRYLARPHWIRAPASGPAQKLFPEEAAKAGLKAGSATVDCVIAPDGALTQCAVISESAPNVGFGVMAVKLAQAFAANPWTDDGLPAEGAHIRLPVKMVDAEADKLAPGAAPAAKP